jgi:hypothetical protein
MAKTVSVTLNGTTWAMPASYAASREIAAAVGDPLQLAISAHQKGAVDFTVDQVVDVIAIGVRLAGCSLPRDKIGEAIFEDGLINFVGLAGEYIGTLVSGGPEKAIPVGKKKAR